MSYSRYPDDYCDFDLDTEATCPSCEEVTVRLNSVSKLLKPLQKALNKSKDPLPNEAVIFIKEMCGLLEEDFIIQSPQIRAELNPSINDMVDSMNFATLSKRIDY